MNCKTDTEIKFNDLKPGVYNYDIQLGGDFFSRFENEKILDGKVDFAVRLEKNERLMMFYFSFSGTIETVCDRCLDKMTVDVSGDDALCVQFSDTEVSDKEDVVFLRSNEYKIDLAQWMYEYVAVAMPMQCLHDPKDCDPEMTKYISAEPTDAPDEASDETIDARWEKLKELK